LFRENDDSRIYNHRDDYMKMQDPFLGKKKLRTEPYVRCAELNDKKAK